jgi:site-specific DNA recombinase
MKILNPPKRDINDLADLRLALYCRASEDSTGKEKSVTDQEAEGHRWASTRGCRVSATFTDNDRSASRFATKARPQFERLVEAIIAGVIDVVWFWELSRSQRRLDVFVQLRNLCRERGVLWVVAGRVYDLTNYGDLMALGFQAVNGEVESELISERVRRGQASSASAGKPHGKLPYGYRRVYDERGRYVRQEANEALREAIGNDGASFWYSPAGVMREIFTRVANGDPLITIERSLNERGIPSPREGSGWRRSAIRKMVLSPTYAGRRVHQGETLEIAAETWPALVPEDVFYAATNVLHDPARTTTKPARAVHLLSYLVKCAACGKFLQYTPPSGRRGQATYACIDRCVGIVAADLDAYVSWVVVEYLSRQDVYDFLMASANNDAKVVVARAECERLRAELEEWRRLAEQGEVAAISFARTEKGLLAKIAEEEAKTVENSLPPILRGRIGAAAAEGWVNADLPIKREITRAVADIRISPAGKGRRNVPIRQRIANNWRWLIGPDQDINTTDPQM